MKEMYILSFKVFLVLESKYISSSSIFCRTATERESVWNAQHPVSDLFEEVPASKKYTNGYTLHGCTCTGCTVRLRGIVHVWHVSMKLESSTHCGVRHLLNGSGSFWLHLSRTFSRSVSGATDGRARIGVRIFNEHTTIRMI